MHPFEYVAPTRLDDALDRLSRAGGETILLGGGTATVLLMKQDLIAPDVVIDLGRIAELEGIDLRPDGGLRLGATCRLADLEDSAPVGAAYPVVARTARRVGNVRVRNVATLGGNLVHADPAQDLPPVLMALGATVTLASRRGARRLPLDAFYVGFMETAIARDELLTEVELPPPPEGLRATYIKFTPRSQDDYGTVNIACALVLEGGICRSAALVVGGAGATPLRIRSAEACLNGHPLSDARIAEASTFAAEEIDPWDDLRGSATYKRAMARVWTARALTALRHDAPGTGAPRLA
jgi:aerobic carbon-monoxide dehydrogenase medium subunit